jgi:hypothetical protein
MSEVVAHSQRRAQGSFLGPRVVIPPDMLRRPGLPLAYVFAGADHQARRYRLEAGQDGFSGDCPPLYASNTCQAWCTVLAPLNRRWRSPSRRFAFCKSTSASSSSPRTRSRSLNISISARRKVFLVVSHGIDAGRLTPVRTRSSQSDLLRR